ncbi:MAG: peptidase [Acidobacteria bacterium]|nr:peptidase [Acidobacteriota bacterium]
MQGGSMASLHKTYVNQTVRPGRFLILPFALIFMATALWAQRTELKPGWNLFSPDQDVELGRQVAADAERQLPMLKDSKVDNYLNRLGLRLAAKAPGAKYPYQFQAVNDVSINAFALPGGFLFIHRGTIESADTEAQLAGVIGHEIGHAALRHGTNQASKAYLAQAPLAIFGGVMGSNSVAAVLAQIGGGFAANSVLLKYSRDAERQADLFGTQILYDTQYDPRAMAQFFEKLQAEGQSRMPEWLSSHPKPENRIDLITEEINRLGGIPQGVREDSTEFREIQSYVRTLPKPKGGPAGGQPAAGQPGAVRPAKPSNGYRNYSTETLQLRHPDNWSAQGTGQSITLAPENGTIASSQGEALAYGMIISTFSPRAGKSGRFELQDATDQLIRDLQQSNPSLRVTQTGRQTRVGGTAALSTVLQNDSPVGGVERDWLVTVLRPEGLVYFIGVAPENDYGDYRRAFETLIDSIRFTNR